MVKTIQEAKIWAEGVVDCLNFNDDCSLENLWTIIKKYLPKDWCLDVFLSLEIEWNDYGYEIVNGEPKEIEEEEDEQLCGLGRACKCSKEEKISPIPNYDKGDGDWRCKACDGYV
mgnify:CR=1 FL=1